MTGSRFCRSVSGDRRSRCSVMLGTDGKSGVTLRCVVGGCGGFIGTGTGSCFLVNTSGRSVVRRKVVKLCGTIESFSTDGAGSFGKFTSVYVAERVVATVGATAERGRVPLGSCVSLGGPICSRRSREALLSVVTADVIASPRRLVVDGRRLGRVRSGVGRLLDSLRLRIIRCCLGNGSCRCVTSGLGESMGSVSGTLREIGEGLRGRLRGEGSW